MTEINSPEGLIRRFQTQLEHQWRRYRDIEADDSARGSSYESALRDVLQMYFGGRFDLHTNCSVMDQNLACFDAFHQNAQNEIDVLALFSHATPRIVLHEGDIQWVPLAGISFLCEVKSRIEKGKLKTDLEKLKILRSLEKDPNDRFGTKVHGDLTVDHQLHCLIYDRAQIADTTMESLLKGSDAWDLLLIVEEDTLVINSTLPVLKIIERSAIGSHLIDNKRDPERKRVASPDEEIHFISSSNGLAWFILSLSHSIPVPIGISTANTLHELITYSMTGMEYGATTEVNDDDMVEFEEVDDFEDPF